VTFDIDANGIVNVSAKDKATGKEQQIRIQASGGLSDADIELMVQDAEANADADKERRAKVETRNQADALVHMTGKNLAEFGDKVSEEEKSAIASDLETLKTALADEESTVDDLQAKVQALAQSSMKLGEAMYKAQQEEAGPDGEGSGGDGSAARSATAPRARRRHRRWSGWTEADSCWVRHCPTGLSLLRYSVFFRLSQLIPEPWP
jgi:molecular chaperone DnaK